MLDLFGAGAGVAAQRVEKARARGCLIVGVVGEVDGTDGEGHRIVVGVGRAVGVDGRPGGPADGLLGDLMRGPGREGGVPGRVELGVVDGDAAPGPHLEGV